ncbi:MAG: hypothetical protein AAGB24_15620 [Bacteroidota bacterium]
MARTLKLNNTGKVPLSKMSEKEIRGMVIKQAEEMLDRIPKDLRVSQVNSIQLESSLSEIADVGAWAQWTRACCDKRNRIDDFINPVINELSVSDPLIEKNIFQDHFDSNFEIKQVTEASSLKKINARSKK